MTAPMPSPMPILSPVSKPRAVPVELRPTSRAAARPVLAPTIILGMPHLCLAGLSETWLLKECGHRHWFMLAEAVGMRVPDFRDEAGEPVYAAFTSAAIRDASFDTLREHDELTFATALARISRTQVVSIHQLIRSGRPIGEVELTSVFVKRRKPGRNRSIARVSMQHLPAVRTAPGFGRAADIAAAVRTECWREHFGFRREDGSEQASMVLDPCRRRISTAPTFSISRLSRPSLTAPNGPGFASRSARRWRAT
jgi:probable biosynthetic protein (TIGR04098 family)